jgi:adenylylsulfate kinase
MAKHIHPIFDKSLSVREKERLLNQKGIVLWLTGLSGSGKSTIALGVERKLYQLGILTELLDGDNIRTGLNNNLGFSEEERSENIRRVAETAKLFRNCGVVTLCSFVSPTKAIRAQAEDIIGTENFYEIYVDASFETCTARDVKGLYEKAIAGEIKNFTGLDAPFEPSKNPFLVLNTETDSVDESIDKLYKAVLPLIRS